LGFKAAEEKRERQKNLIHHIRLWRYATEKEVWDAAPFYCRRGSSYYDDPFLLGFLPSAQKKGKHGLKRWTWERKLSVAGADWWIAHLALANNFVQSSVHEG
jgi:hypothetical protein